jgi:hypothetical protein
MRWLLPAVLAAACGGAPTARQDAATAAARALEFLFAHQQDDGGFRSDVHGVLKPGYSLAATVLLVCALLPEPLRAPHRDGIARALRFLENATDREGAIGLGGEVVDYPCYTSAHYLHALVRLRPPGSAERIAQQIARLRRLQLDEDEGWQPSDFAYGAFGFGVRSEPRPLGAELVDVSLVASVVEALRAAGVGAADPVIVRARAFVARCQRLRSEADPGGDGGFFFTPEPDFRASKAGLEKGADGVERPRTYGTATGDGIRALLLCGAGAADPGLAAARAWLERHLDFEHVPGLPRDAAPPVEPALRFYWWATLARTLRALGWPGGWREQLVAAVAKHQRADGGFAGFSDLMKEDDPVVATCLALLALGAAME